MFAELHPELKELAPLLGTWVGRGSGDYPTVQPFEYFVEVVFSHVGKSFLVYGHKTSAADDGRPLHAETGYLRVPRPGNAELVLAHPSGIAEIELGSYSVDNDGVVQLDFATTAIGLTPTAKEVTAIARSFRFDGDEFSYSLQMAAVGQPLQHHTAALLRRQP